MKVFRTSRMWNVLKNLQIHHICSHYFRTHDTYLLPVYVCTHIYIMHVHMYDVQNNSNASFLFSPIAVLFVPLFVPVQLFQQSMDRRRHQPMKIVQTCTGTWPRCMGIFGARFVLFVRRARVLPSPLYATRTQQLVICRS